MTTQSEFNELILEAFNRGVRIYCDQLRCMWDELTDQVFDAHMWQAQKDGVITLMHLGGISRTHAAKKRRLYFVGDESLERGIFYVN